MPYKQIILSFVADATSDMAPIHQLREKAMTRLMTTLSETEQSQSVASFIMEKVADNISFQLEIRKHYLSDVDNCDLDLTCGGEKPVKIMIRKLNSKDGVVSKEIDFRGLVGDNSGSDSRVSSIETRDELGAHLSCYPDGTVMEIHICASELQLPQFLRNSSESEDKEVSPKVILVTLAEDNSVAKCSDNPDMNEIKEFTKNDKQAISTNPSNKTSSNKNGKRKATSTDSEKPNKNAKTTAKETEQAEEAPKTPKKTTTDTSEPPTVENTKKSPKKSNVKSTKKSPKKKSKGKKDRNEPKKPLAPYMQYSKDNRSRIREENPEFDFGEIGKELGKQWQKVSSEEKKKLKAAYQKDLKKYKKQLEKYKKKNGESDKSKNTPKTADQAVNSSDSTPSNKNGKRKATSTDSEKPNKSAKTAAKETEQAEEAPKTPKKTTTDTSEPPTVENTKKSPKKLNVKSTKKSPKKKSKGKKDRNAPKRPLTPYIQYSKDNRSRIKKKNPEFDFGEIGKELGKQWQKVSSEEKKKLKAAYQKGLKKYEKQLEKYKKKKKKSNEAK